MPVTLLPTASASSCVKLWAEPRPEETCVPGPRWEPGSTKIKFDPIDWMLDWMDCSAPCPIETIAITEPIPITMPSIVSPDRTLFTVRDAYVSWNRSESVMWCDNEPFFCDDFYCLPGLNRPEYELSGRRVRLHRARG